MKAIKTLIIIIFVIVLQSCSKENKCDRMTGKEADYYNEAADLMMSGLEDQNKTKYNQGRNKMIDFYDCFYMGETPLQYDQALEN